MKRFLLTLFVLLAARTIVQAEEPNPLSFFPHQVGDTWVYLRESSLINRDSITKVETDVNNNILIYHDNVNEPTYRIDTNFNVFFYPQTFEYFLEYKLTAKKGDMWKVTKYSSTSLVATLQNIYTTSIFGRTSTVMQIAYFEVPDPDTVITDESPYRYTQFVATGFGFIRQIGESGDIPIDLIGCIINGDTLGTVTGVGEEENNPSFVQTFPNPCSSFTTIHCSLSASIATLHMEIIDVFGRTIHSSDIRSDSYILNTSTFPDGIYFCRMTAGTHITTQKIIVHK